MFTPAHNALSLGTWAFLHTMHLYSSLCNAAVPGRVVTCLYNASVFNTQTLTRQLHVQIYAFDTSASPGKSAVKGLATYKSAACRMFLYVQMTSQPANETVGPGHLFVAAKGANTSELAARRKLLSKVFHASPCSPLLPRLGDSQLCLHGLLAWNPHWLIQCCMH